MRALVLVLMLSGCAQLPYGGVSTSSLISAPGPQFLPSQFDCGDQPLAPDPAKATGKIAALYEARLNAWGQGCSNKLGSIGAALAGAGMVAQGK